MRLDPIRIVPATTAHALLMANDLRMADRAEIEAMGETPEQALIYSLQHSLESWVAVMNDVPIAMWGIGTSAVLGNVATPWLLTTPYVEWHKVRFMREAKEFVERKAHIWKVLYGYTDSRYEKAIKLLQWLGFSVDFEDRAYWPLVRFERRA